VSGLKSAARAVAGAPKKATIGFWRGLRYPFRGAAFVYTRHTGLVKWWIWPILMTLVAVVAVVWSSYAWYDDLTNAIWSEPTGDGFWESVGRGVHAVFSCFLCVMLPAVGLLAVFFLTSVFAAPFNDLLSEEVEEIATGVPGPKFSFKVLARDAVRTIFLELFKLFVWLSIMGPLLLVGIFVPVISPIVDIIGFLFTALYFAVDYIDWPASRRNRGIRYRFGLLGKHFLPMLGFGVGVWLFLFIPFVNLFFMPAAVAGGTLLYLDLEAGQLEG
jgi:CysZ protein